MAHVASVCPGMHVGDERHQLLMTFAIALAGPLMLVNLMSWDRMSYLMAPMHVVHVAPMFHGFLIRTVAPALLQLHVRINGLWYTIPVSDSVSSALLTSSNSVSVSQLIIRGGDAGCLYPCVIGL